MIDERLYRKTFSRLCASEEAKKEVFQMIPKNKYSTHLPKVLRAGAIAAVMTAALAVTAGAVNLATGGSFFQTLRQVWSDGYETRYEAVDSDGNSMALSVTQGAWIQEAEDGRLILHAAGEETDITDELRDNGEARFEKNMELRTVQVAVTGTLEDWVMEETVIEEDGSVYRSQTTSDEMTGDLDVSMSGVKVTREEPAEDASAYTGTVTVTTDGDGDGSVTVTDGEGRSSHISGAALPAVETEMP